ncbi:hypothetical protein [Rickettsia akari]|uniref:hypothetical protein n=1 Tax=Rickettsia akari TaxID=786 RepID=UPI001E3CCF3B|nr:hypothetical protein [Rickettsia akari]
MYKLLINDNEINTKINKIYFAVVQDAKCPFLLINILNVNNVSTNVQNIIQLEFERCIFTNDKNRNIALSLASKISDQIEHYSFENVAWIKANKIELQASKDLVNTKLVMNYHALLKSHLCSSSVTGVVCMDIQVVIASDIWSCGNQEKLVKMNFHDIRMPEFKFCGRKAVIVYFSCYN